MEGKKIEARAVENVNLWLRFFLDIRQYHKYNITVILFYTGGIHD